MATDTLGFIEPGTEPIAPELRIVEWQNEWIVRSAYEYDYQAPDEMLKELRERYELDDVISSGRTEWEQMLLLREWVRTRWDHGWSKAVNPNNALEILEAAGQGNDFSCGYYSMTLMQSMLALGFVSRRINIAKAQTEWMAYDEGNIGHNAPEVYSHDWHKWIILDSDKNVHYELDGVPLSALEIHRAWVGGGWSEVRMIQGQTPFKRTDKASSGLYKVWDTLDEADTNSWTFTRHQTGDYYSNVGVYLGNTHHSRLDPAIPNNTRSRNKHTVDTITEGSIPMLHWIDDRTAPRLISVNYPNKDQWTGNEHDMYPSVDQVQINLRADPSAWENGEAVLDVIFEDSMPNLEKLLVRVDHEPWHEAERNCRWKLNPGKNEIMAKGINSFGREGHMSRILLRFHP